MCDCVKDDGVTQIPYTHDIRAGFYNYNQLKEEYYPHLLMMENVEYPATISNWLILFKREVASNIRYIEGVRYSEDLLFGAQLLYNAKSFYYMKGEFYYHYWMNNESASHTFKIDKWKDYSILYQNIVRFFVDENMIDFSHQTDLVLLFFIYNAVGEIISCDQLDSKSKRKYAFLILNDSLVRNLFKRLKINKLQIGFKQKIITYIYKYKLGLGALILRGR